MPLPPLSKLESAARKVVLDARAKGNLKDLTPRTVRRALEEQFALEEGSLETSEYKSAIKAATMAAVREPEPEPETPKKNRKPKRDSSGKGKSGTDSEDEEQSLFTPKSKGKQKAIIKDEGESDGGVKKKRKVSKKEVVSDDEHENHSKPASTSNRRRSQKQTFKSAEHVATSDMDEDSPIKNPISSTVTKTKSKPASKSEHTPEKKTKTKQPKQEASDEEDVIMSEDAQPKKKKSSGSDKKTKKPRAKKDTPALSKDEETIKRLKALVVACGTRKVWSKVFQGLDTPSQQIKKLKEMLSELGMTGRMSMDQAKAIKEKREFEQELADVQSFAKAIESKATRSRSTKSLAESENESGKEDVGEDDEDEVPVPKRSSNARRSIAAFLQDQSSDED